LLSQRAGMLKGMTDELLSIARGVSDWTGDPVPAPRWSQGRRPLDELRLTLLAEPGTVLTVGGEKGLTETGAKRVVRSFGRSDPATLLRRSGRLAAAGTAGEYRTRAWSRDPSMRRWMVDVCYIPPGASSLGGQAEGGAPVATP